MQVLQPVRSTSLCGVGVESLPEHAVVGPEMCRLRGQVLGERVIVAEMDVDACMKAGHYTVEDPFLQTCFGEEKFVEFIV